MNLRLSRDAEADLAAFRDYVRPRSQQGYNRVLAAVFYAFDQLEVFPFLGREGEVPGTRELTVPRTPFRIVYSLPDQYHIEVERVLDSRLRYPRESSTR